MPAGYGINREINVPDPRDRVRVPPTIDAGPGCPGGGTCGRIGWLQVDPAEAARLHPLPPRPGGQMQLGDPEPDPADVAVWGLQVAKIESLRRATVNSWLPCPDCQVMAFYRWAGGHLDPRHARHECSECAQLGTRAAATRRRSHAEQDAAVAAALATPPDGAAVADRTWA